VHPLLQRICQRISDRFDPESNHLLRNSSWVFIANGAGTLFGFLKVILMTRILGVELLGVYSIAIAFVLTTQEFLRLNISMGLIRFGAAYLAEGRRDKVVAVIRYSLLLSLLSVLLSVLIIGIIILVDSGSFIKDPGLEPYVMVFAVVNGLSFIDALSKSSLKLFYKFKINSVIQMIMDSLEFALIAGVLLIKGPDLPSFFMAVIAAKLANSLTCNIAAYRELQADLKEGSKTRLSVIRSDYGAFLRYIFGNSMSSSLKVLMNQGDVLLLGTFGTTAQTGFYTTAKKLAYSILSLTDPLAASVFPQFSRLMAEKKHEAAVGMIRKMTSFLTVPAILMLALAFFMGEPLVIALYGQSFTAAATPFVILLASALQGAVFFWALPLLQSLGLITKRLLIYLAAIIAGASCSMILIQEFGAGGVATGLLVANLVITGSFVFYIRKELKNRSLQGTANL